MKWKRRRTYRALIFILFSLCSFFLSPFSVQGVNATETERGQKPTAISAEGYALMDLSTDEVLMSNNLHERMFPASTTKLITALLFAEAYPTLTGSYTCGSEIIITDKGASMAGFEVGQTVSYRDLMYGLLLPSGNDAANAIAVLLAGSIEEFAEMINDRLHALGMENTHFVNPSGLPNANHYTTPYDMALLAKACMQNELLMEIFGTMEYTLPANTRYPNGNKIRNTNALMQKLDRNGRANGYFYEYANGMKTGSTMAAGACFIASASYEGRKLIVVLLKDTTGGNNRWPNAAALFNYAFFGTTVYELRNRMASLSIPVLIPREEDIGYPLNAVLEIPFDYPERKVLDNILVQVLQESTGPTIQIVMAPSAVAPIEQGQVIGTASVFAEDVELISTNIMSSQFVSDLYPRWSFYAALFCACAFFLFQLLYLFFPFKQRRNFHGRFYR